MIEHYMTGNAQNFPHTAISTWSGFVYQGKLALYHCLKLMTDDFNGHRELKLQLESQDDFAIFQADKCLSLHQVKAYKGTLFSNYHDAINTQKENANQRDIQNAYFHVASKITELPITFEQDYRPVKLYTYPLRSNPIGGQTQNYCPLNEVDKCIEEQICTLIKATNSLPNWKKGFCIKIREALEARVNEKVIAVHYKIHKAGQNQHQAKIAAQEFIAFAAFYLILEADDYNDLDNEAYFLSRLQIDIGIYYQEFCEQQDTQAQAQQDKLDNYLASIITLNIQEMKGFLRATMPHRKGRFATLSEFKDETFDRDSMRQGLFTVFHKLVLANKAADNKIQFAWFTEDQFYYPTGIHTAPEHQDVLCRDILQQASEDVELLFEGGALITSAINRPCITSVKVGVDATEEEIPTRTTICNYQPLSLISLNNVPESLKDAPID